MSYNKTIWHARDIITAEKMQKIENQLEALSNISNMTIHICTNGEYNTTTYVPTINNPNTNTIYLAPGINGANNIYTEWIYVNNSWEKFGEAATSFAETDPTVPSWAKAAQKPTYTAQEVGALPSNTAIPSKVSDLTNDAGYLTQHQDISGKANSADLAVVATSGSYNDLSNKPTIPSLEGYATQTYVGEQITSEINTLKNGNVITISDSIVTINAAQNTRYVCGTVSTISITPCSTGICSVRFTSGGTAALLTLPNTVLMPEWFDAASLDTNTIYEICIVDGIYGTVITWDN